VYTKRVNGQEKKNTDKLKKKGTNERKEKRFIHVTCIRSGKKLFKNNTK
jgi:hypothetical protein